MSVLSDGDIKSEFLSGGFKLDPWDVDNVQPASYDVHLGGTVRKYAAPGILIDCVRPQDLTFDEDCSKVGKFILKPDEFALGHTIERIELGNYLCARLEGKSSLGRLGLCVHVTAGWFDPGFHGTATIELYNFNSHPLVLEVGMPIAQFTFMYVSSTVDNLYSGAYNDQSTPRASKGAT